MKKIYLLFLLGLVLLIAGCTQSDQSSTEGSSKNKILTIEITSDGFSPNPLIIGMGDRVTWINKDTVEHWPASAIHPTHEVYPESGGCIGSKFDACRGLKEGESWSFTFNEKGEWNYHDHLTTGLYGKVIVQ